jgi:hypothetical protein
MMSQMNLRKSSSLTSVISSDKRKQTRNGGPNQSFTETGQRAVSHGPQGLSPARQLFHLVTGRSGSRFICLTPTHTRKFLFSAPRSTTPTPRRTAKVVHRAENCSDALLRFALPVLPHRDIGGQLRQISSRENIRLFLKVRSSFAERDACRPGALLLKRECPEV